MVGLIEETRLVLVGNIGKPHGIKGWSRVNSFTNPPSSLVNYSPWVVKKQNDQRIYKISEHKIMGSIIQLRMEGCEDRTHASLYTNAEILVERDQFPATQNNEYYWTDLENLVVVNDQGFNFGIVEYLFSNGVHDVLAIKGEKLYFIPFILREFVSQVDLKAGLIRVNWEPDF